MRGTGRSAEDASLPGAVWRSGWVDMTMMLIAPLVSQRELLGGFLGEFWAAIDGKDEKQESAQVE